MVNDREMKIISVIGVDTNGDLHTIYTDEVDLYEIGTVKNVTRASHVEFDERRQVWQIITHRVRKIIFEHPSRKVAIEKELELLAVDGEYYKQ